MNFFVEKRNREKAQQLKLCQIYFFCNNYYIRQKFILIYIIVKKDQKHQKQKRKTNFLKHVKTYKRQFKKV